MTNAKLTIGLGLIVALAGCAGETTEAGTLAIESAGADSLVGSFEYFDEVAEFEVFQVEDQVFDITVLVHGMVLHATFDRASEVAELDGFDAATGADTQVLEDDQAILQALYEALEPDFAGDTGAPDVLVRFVKTWAQYAVSMDLQRTVMGEESRSYNSICSQYGTYQLATHDDWDYDRWDVRATSNALVGSRGSCTLSLVGGSWTCSEPDHVNYYVKQKGECYGDCGAGCPSGLQDLTTDCLDHDQCVRSGHALASSWCSDELASTADDAAYAPYCSGT